MTRIPDRIRRMEMPAFDPLNGRAAELRAEGHHVISLGQALPFFAPPPEALAAARSALDRPEVSVYSTDAGLQSLRAALAERLSHTLRTTCAAADLVITAGANHAFSLALPTLVDPGDEVVLPSPYFTNHQMAIVALGAVPVEAAVADRETFALRWSDIEPRLTSRTRAVVLCTPSNPTGAVVDPREGERIVAGLAARGIVLISDETYMHIVYGRPHWSAASAPAWRDNVVVLGTFSKSFGMMGWRLGFMLADGSVCEHAIKIQDAMIICAPRISQMAGEAAVRESWDYPLSFHADLLERRRVLQESLAAVPGGRWTPTEGGFFAFVKIPGCDDSIALATELLEQAHVVTIPGAAFGRSGEGYLRISYGAAAIANLPEAVQRMQRFFIARAGASGA
jgi:aspartate/methionine/tyrosine aminotransferase